MKEYLAHYNKENKKKQTIKEHSYNVANMAQSFSIDILKPIVYTIGLAHDIGKYANRFQERINGNYSIKFQHSPCGAIELGKLCIDDLSRNMTYMLQYCIAGHHTGLPDGGNITDTKDKNTLQGILKKDNYMGEQNYSSYINELNLTLPVYNDFLQYIMNNIKNDKKEFIESYAFFTRYVFSCLTDADYIDSEQSMINNRYNYRKTINDYKCDFRKALSCVNNKLKSFIHDTELKRARNKLQTQAFRNAKNSNAEINLLNMPTGSGKTLCSVKIALEKCIKLHKKRIIYVIPYTSIIDQTAKEFRELFGNHIDIIEHHCNHFFENCESTETLNKYTHKLATENWDAPFIITTNVQFFESVYSNKSSRLRKMHNMSDSIIVFDEIHMLPLEYLQPCLRCISYITKNLNSVAFLMSATLPDYTKYANKYWYNSTVAKLITNTKDFKYFEKCKYYNLGMTNIDKLLDISNPHRSSLIIVNTKKLAYDIYNKIHGKKYHLSTRMTLNDRTKTIRKIRKSLRNGEKITVVSTSLVECGVDFDFDAVFRQMSGLDNIIQSAGRCNRDGRYTYGDVYIFELEEEHRYFNNQIGIGLVKDLIRNLPDFNDITNIETVRKYYDKLFNINEQDIEHNTIYKKDMEINEIPFKSYSEHFRFINTTECAIVINNYKKVDKLLQKASTGNRNAIRQLKKYTVSIRNNIDSNTTEFNIALNNGLITNYKDSGIYVLTDTDLYSQKTGLIDLRYII